jgi:hypothetical protein
MLASRSRVWSIRSASRREKRELGDDGVIRDVVDRGPRSRRRRYLGIKVPAGCTLTVAGEERTWVEGKCLAFNNSFRHHAKNTGTEVRAILSIHALHPALTPVERSAIASLIKALAQA